MSPRETIGIDLGGTKMASGVVDESQNVLHQSRERSTGLSEDELIKELEEEIAEARWLTRAVVVALPERRPDSIEDFLVTGRLRRA